MIKFLLPLLLLSSPVFAADGDCYTLEDGTETFTQTASGWVRDDNGKITEFEDMSGGTGVPTRGLYSDATKESLIYRFYKDAMIVSMDVYVAGCKK